MRFILKWKKEDGSFTSEGFDRMADLIKRMKYLTAYNMYFQVIHNVE